MIFEIVVDEISCNFKHMFKVYQHFNRASLLSNKETDKPAAWYKNPITPWPRGSAIKDSRLLLLLLFLSPVYKDWEREKESWNADGFLSILQVP